MPKTKTPTKLPLHRLAVTRLGATGLERIIDDIPADMTMEQFERALQAYVAHNRPQTISRVEIVAARVRRFSASEKEFLLRALVVDLYGDEPMALMPMDDCLALLEKTGGVTYC